MQLTVQPNYCAKTTKIGSYKQRISKYSITGLDKVSFKGDENTFDYSTQLNKKLEKMGWFKKNLFGGRRRAELQTTIELIDFRDKKCEKTEARLNLKEDEIKTKEEVLRVKKVEAKQIKAEGIQIKEEAIEIKENAIKIKREAILAQEKTLEIEEKSVCGSIDSSQVRKEIQKTLKEKEAFLEDQLAEVKQKDTFIESLKQQVEDLKIQLTKKQEAYNTISKNLEIAKKEIVEINDKMPKIIINVGKKIK